VLYLPTAFLVTRYPVPSPFENCTTGCPHNAFQVTGHQPGFIDPALVRLRNIVTVLLVAGAPLILAARMRRATPVARRALQPVTAASSVYPISLAVATAARTIAPDSRVVDVGAQLLVLSISAIAVAFLLGLVRRRLFEAAALERLARTLGRTPSAADLRHTLAEALGDPSLELWYADDKRKRWQNADGAMVLELPSVDGRAVSSISRNGHPTAALVHDPGLLEEPGLVRAAGDIAGAALENQRLALALDASLNEVEESRLRIASAADDARRRIEQDLHDGAQQSLVTLRVRLELAAERLHEDPSLGAEALRSLGDEVDQINDEVRSLASGIYPSLLTGSGLVEALRSVALRAPVAVNVTPDHVGRYPAAVESAVYFTCLEALQNATKHAKATRVDIHLADDEGKLRFSVVDDGQGFDPRSGSSGAGLTSMRDRIATVGGTVAICSVPGRGTSVSGEVAPAIGRSHGRRGGPPGDHGDRLDGPRAGHDRA